MRGLAQLYNHNFFSFCLTFFLFAFSLIFFLSALASRPSSSPSPSPLPPMMAKTVTRLATLADVEQVTNVFITAMSSNPSWDYRYPHRKKYPEDHLRSNRDVIRRFISPDYPDWTIKIVEVIGEGSQNESKVVSFSIWDLSYVNKRLHGPSYKAPAPGKDSADACGPGRDQNPTHLAAFFAALAECKRKYFDAFGDERLSLQILGTLPEFRRHGFATSLVRWGMEKAAQDNVVFTLSASPQGSRLYTQLGFRDLGTQTMQAPDEEEFLVINAMVYEPKPGDEKVKEVL